MLHILARSCKRNIGTHFYFCCKAEILMLHGTFLQHFLSTVFQPPFVHMLSNLWLAGEKAASFNEPIMEFVIWILNLKLCKISRSYIFCDLVYPVFILLLFFINFQKWQIYAKVALLQCTRVNRWDYIFFFIFFLHDCKQKYFAWISIALASVRVL